MISQAKANNKVLGAPPAGSAEWLCEVARPLIQSKVRRLVGRTGITRSDCDDIQQAIFSRLLKRVAKRPKSCHWMVFIVRIVDQSIANELRGRTAAKRNSANIASLNAPAGTRGSIDLSQNVCQSQLEVRLGRRSRDPLELANLGMDVEEFVFELAEDQRELCRLLGTHSISALAQLLNQPRTTIQDKIRKLRQRFEDRGLCEYLT